MQKTEYIGIRIEPGIKETLENNLSSPDETISDVVRNILRDWAKKKKRIVQNNV